MEDMKQITYRVMDMNQVEKYVLRGEYTGNQSDARTEVNWTYETPGVGVVGVMALRRIGDARQKLSQIAEKDLGKFILNMESGNIHEMLTGSLGEDSQPNSSVHLTPIDRQRLKRKYDTIKAGAK